MAKPEPLLEIKMAVSSKGDRKIKIEGERDKEQEVTIRHEAVPQKKASSVWSWYEEFAAESNETFITKKRKKIQKDEKERREK